MLVTSLTMYFIMCVSQGVLATLRCVLMQIARAFRPFPWNTPTIHLSLHEPIHTLVLVYLYTRTHTDLNTVLLWVSMVIFSK